MSKENNGTARSKRSRALAKAGIIVPSKPIYASDKPAYDALVAKAADEVERVTKGGDDE